MNRESVILEAQQLGRRIPGGQEWLLDQVSLALRAGDRLVVTGPSGSGKTLLLRALAMLDPIDCGQVMWKDHVLAHETIPFFRAQVMYLHQRPALFEDTVEGALRQPYSLRVHHQKNFDRDRVIELLASLNRDASFLEKRVRDLSGGESQIVALVRALQLNPTVLLLDEPTAALDVQSMAAAEALLNRWVASPAVANGSQARAWVWVTHDADQAQRVASERIIIERGRATKLNTEN